MSRCYECGGGFSEEHRPGCPQWRGSLQPKPAIAKARELLERPNKFDELEREAKPATNKVAWGAMAVAFCALAMTDKLSWKGNEQSRYATLSLRCMQRVIKLGNGPLVNSLEKLVAELEASE